MSNTPRWLREAAWNRADATCEAMIPNAGCQWFGTDVHHRKMRSAGGEHTLENALWACRACHTFIHSNPAFGYKSGLLIHAWQDVTWPPRYYRGIDTPPEEET